MKIDRIVKLTKRNNSFDRFYGELVEKKIRKKYSVGEELAILRQRDTKPDEFAAYNEYVEQCKTETKEELGVK